MDGKIVTLGSKKTVMNIKKILIIREKNKGLELLNYLLTDGLYWEKSNLPSQDISNNYAQISPSKPISRFETGLSPKSS